MSAAIVLSLSLSLSWVTAPQLLPAQMDVEADRMVIGAELRDVETCGACHADAVAQWRTSAHAFASFNNPVYRVSVETVRKNAGTKASRMCASCHDVALLTEGAMDVEEISPEDPRAHAAITCQTCHGIRAVRPTGNGSYTLAADPLVLPLDGSAASIAAHKASVAPSELRTAELCGSCHRSFLDGATGNAATIFGMDELTSWSRSAYAGSHADRIDRVDERTCQGCHMPREVVLQDDAAAKNGTIASHRFFGGHTWLRAMLGDSAQLEENQRFLEGAARIDVPGGRTDDGRWRYPIEQLQLNPGARLSFDVVIENRRAGHAFPGGVQDAQDTWIEVQVFDRHGSIVAENREHQLRSEMLDEAGVPLHGRETNRFVAAAWNHTVGPRDARAARYELQVPDDGDRLPLRLVVRLLHRTRNPTLAALACADQETERGRRFQSASMRLNGASLDACVAPPITEIARTEHALGSPDERLGGRVSIAPERLYAHGLALSKSLQEDLAEANVPLLIGLRLAKTSVERAQIEVVLAKVAARRSRLDESLRRLRSAEARIGPAASIDCVRAEAFARVWRWEDAAREAEHCVARAPRDLEARVSLAVALGSSGQHALALAAADAGLLLHPLEPSLLRVRALALQAMGAPNEVVEGARAEFLYRRTADGGPRARGLCSMNVPGCATARNPIPHRTLEPPT